MCVECVCHCASEEVRGRHSHCPPTSPETRSLTEPVARLVTSKSCDPPISAPPSARGYSCMPPCLSVCMSVGIQTQVQMPTRPLLLPTKPFPQSEVCFYKVLVQLVVLFLLLHLLI